MELRELAVHVDEVQTTWSLGVGSDADELGSLPLSLVGKERL
jgi:hypothetical protein